MFFFSFAVMKMARQLSMSFQSKFSTYSISPALYMHLIIHTLRFVVGIIKS